MKISNRGLLEIAEHEGIVPAPYYDSAGVLTFGIGHTKAAGGIDPAGMRRGMPADLDEAIDRAIAVFRADVPKYERRVNDAITAPLEQHEFDALVSFDFNTGGIHRAQLTKAINARQEDASRHFFGWLKPPEIRKRRTAEKNLFDTGNYDGNGSTIPVWKVDASGKLRGIYTTITGDELLRRMAPAMPEPKPAPKQHPIAAFFAAIARLFKGA
ncbi:lysozyme [Limimaricola cinnabarinus]|uniref:lysozyme n=1 Tax=Limimaricola cinnabarinus TaxID=1125964 RepID=UPI002493413C|nr:lysozyme [Limimaricola cinnabarinus]